MPPSKVTSQWPDLRLTVAGQMTDYRRRLAERLQSEREGRSLSRDTLALRSGVSSKTIKRIEERKVNEPRPETIRKLAEALEIVPTALRPAPAVEADQLNRIEAKVDLLLAAAGLELPEGVDDQDEQLVDPLLEDGIRELVDRAEEDDEPDAGKAAGS